LVDNVYIRGTPGGCVSPGRDRAERPEPAHVRVQLVSATGTGIFFAAVLLYVAADGAGRFFVASSADAVPRALGAA